MLLNVSDRGRYQGNDASSEVHQRNEHNRTDEALDMTMEIIIGVNMYGLPIIIFVGLLGNTMAFAVFVASQFRHQSSSVYLAFLNFVDSLFLLCLLITQLEWYNIYLMRIEGLCQIVIYLSYVSGFLSVWTVVSFTVERFIVVYFPLMRLVHCTRRRAIYVVLSLLVGALFLYNYAVWTSQVQDYYGAPNCIHVAKYKPFLNVTAFVDTFITMLVPSMAVIILNILIVLKLCRCVGYSSSRAHARAYDPSEDTQHPHQAETTLTTGISDTESIGPSPHGDQDCRSHIPSSRLHSISSTRKFFIRHQGSSLCCCRGVTQVGSRASLAGPRCDRVRSPTHWSLRRHNSRSQAQQMKTTRTLLIISTLFVVLNLPSHAFRIWVTITPPLDSMPSRTMLLWQLLFQFLYYVNFSCNFFLYCACSQSFRLELRGVLLKCGRNVKSLTTSCWRSCTRTSILF